MGTSAIKSRTLSRILALLALLTVSLAVAARGADSVVRYEAAHQAMGTEFTVAVYGRDRAYLAEVVNEVFEEIEQLDEQMSNYKSESELSVINREAAERDVVVEPKLFHLLEDSVRYSRETDGAFDITVGPLMKHWGFFKGQGCLPSQSEIAAVLKTVGYRHLKLESARRTVRFDEAGVELDLGGIAKGYAVDRAVELLRSYGVTAALVSSGTSSIYALGSPPGERGWKVTARDPYDNRKAADAFLLRDYSISTSGSYEKFFKLGGKTYCHIMNPHTGWPVTGVLSTAVLAPSTTQSDALSTSLFVLGVAGSRRYISGHPGLLLVLYEPVGGAPHFKRVELRSDSFHLAADEIAEIVKGQSGPASE